MTGRLSTLARLAFPVTLVVVLYFAFVPHPPKLAIDSFGDKFEHSLAFVVLSVLASTAFPRMPLARVGERLSFLGALIEVVQAIPALGRDCDILDWITDTAAIAITLLVVAAVRRFRFVRG